jgi:hypothetical protein
MRRVIAIRCNPNKDDGRVFIKLLDAVSQYSFIPMCFTDKIPGRNARPHPATCCR